MLCWGPVPGWTTLNASWCSEPKGTRYSSRRSSGPWRRRRPSQERREPIRSHNRSPRSGSRRVCTRSWRHVSTACRATRSVCSKPRRSSGLTSPSCCCSRSPKRPTPMFGEVSLPSRPPGSSTRRISFPNSSTPSPTRSPTRWRTEPFFSRSGASCTRASPRRWNPSPLLHFRSPGWSLLGFRLGLLPRPWFQFLVPDQREAGPSRGQGDRPIVCPHSGPTSRSTGASWSASCAQAAG